MIPVREGFALSPTNRGVLTSARFSIRETPLERDSLTPKVTQLRLGVPRLSRDSDKAPLGQRISNAVLRPPKPGATTGPSIPDSVDELQHAVRYASDKERLVGLFGAPWAAGIGILVGDNLIAHDPAARLKNGAINHLHVSIGLYHEVLIALLVISLVMLATAWFRKRMYLGMVMALYGLTLFNLHYWGFAIPFILFGAWLLVRAYRLQHALKEAGGIVTRGAPSQTRRGGALASAAPRANKRYTPPSSSARRN